MSKNDNVIIETRPENIAMPTYNNDANLPNASAYPDTSVLQAPPASMLSAYPKCSYYDAERNAPKQKLKIEVGATPLEDKIFVETASTSVQSTRLYNEAQVEAIVADRISKLPKAKKKNGVRNLFIVLTVIFAVVAVACALEVFGIYPILTKIGLIK